MIRNFDSTEQKLSGRRTLSENYFFQGPVGWKAIQRQYFWDQDKDRPLISIRTLQRKYAPSAYECGALIKIPTIEGDRTKAVEPAFTLWMQRTFRKK
jgi:hypothetical protein